MKMKSFRKITALIFVLAMAFGIGVSGSAWADENSVVLAIETLGLSRQAAESGNTITIVNDAGTDPLTKDASLYTNGNLLDLGNISGLTINWKANLTVTGALNLIDPNGWMEIVRFTNGTFNITGGTIDIQTTGTQDTSAIEAYGNTTVTVDGGTLKGTLLSHGGIGAEGSDTEVIVRSGELSFPHGQAIAANKLTVEDPSVITGITTYSKEDDETKYVDIYGTVYIDQPMPLSDHSALAFTVKDNAEWIIDLAALYYTTLGTNTTFLIEVNGEFILNGEGWMDIYGTLTNKGTFTNNSTINVYSGNTLDNQGTLINNGTINNKSTGKVRNTGTIDNTSTGKVRNTGKIDNTDGEIQNDGTFQSVQTAEAMGGNIEGNDVELIDSPSSSGGCSTGIGLLSLLLGGLFVFKKKA
jgi:hypothetical protein